MISSYSAPVQAAHPEHQTVYKKKSKYSLLSKMISDSNNYFRDDTSGQINHHKDCINDSKSSFKERGSTSSTVVAQYSGSSIAGFNPNNANKKNQDCLLMCEDESTLSYLFVCLDGHGTNGEKVSQFVKESLELQLFQHKSFDRDPQSAIREVLLQVERDLCDTEDKHGDYSGTTVCMALIRSKKLIVANIGDSRIILAKIVKDDKSKSQNSSSSDTSNISTSTSSNSCSDNSSSSGEDEYYDKSNDDSCQLETEGGSKEEGEDSGSGSFSLSSLGSKPKHKRQCWRPNQGTDSSNSLTVLDKPAVASYVVESLSVDHKPDLLEEYSRITEAGGRVFSIRYSDGVVGPPRVWLGSSNIPGLAMSRSIGDFVVHQVGVVSTPDIYEVDLDPSTDRIVVIATDGLWDQISNEEAISIAAKHKDAKKAVSALVELARSRWLHSEKSVDDITVCVIYLQND